MGVRTERQEEIETKVKSIQEVAAGKMLYGTAAIAKYLGIDRNKVSRLIAIGVIVGDDDGARGVCINIDKLAEIKIFLDQYKTNHEEINVNEVKVELARQKRQRMAAQYNK